MLSTKKQKLGKSSVNSDGNLVAKIYIFIQIRIMGNHLVIFRNILFGLNIKQSVIQLIKFI